MIRICVVGAGLIGRERLHAIQALRQQGKGLELVGIFDANKELSQKTADEFATVSLPNLQAVFGLSPDWIVVALPHDIAVGVAEEALASGARVLMEKPMGRDLKEADRLLGLGNERLFVGFNYRFYEGISKIIHDARDGRFGDLISVDFLLGHGCFPGQEKTWKLKDERAGGGCLIDPGIHLLDLCLQLAPKGVEIVGGRSWNGFWKTGIEEDVSLMLAADTFTLNLRVSIVHWRSIFRMSVSGTEGYGLVNGRGRSYGPQSYVTGKRWGWQSGASQAASEVTEVETDGSNAFVRETEAVLFPDAADSWPAGATAKEAHAAMDLLHRIRCKLNLRSEY